MQDLMNNIHLGTPTVDTTSDTTAVVSAIVDTQGYDSLMFAIATGTLADADATFTTLVEEGDESDMSDAAGVADVDLHGTEALASFTFTHDDECRKIGYKGNKRYVRCTVTPAANTGAAPITIIPIQGHPHLSPTANPPA